MPEIVFARNGQALTTSAIIAEGVNVQHKNILAILRDYRADFEEFGIFAFETRKLNEGRGRPETFALLNEQQATLLVTYCKNTEVVRKFKVALVKAFFEMHERLHPTCPVAATLTIDAAQQLAVKKAVAKRAKNVAVHYQTLYRALYDRFQIPRYTELLRSDFDDAIRFIETCEIRPQIETAPRIPEGAVVLTREEAQTFLNVAYVVKYLFRPQYKIFAQLLNAVRSPMTGAFWDAFNDLAVTIMEQALERHGLRIEDMECYKTFAAR